MIWLIATYLCFGYLNGQTTVITHTALLDLSHRQLAEDLALAKTMAITEVPLGSMYLNRNRVPRADVLEIKPSYEDFIVTIYDIKRTRADLLGSIRSGKWEQYLPHCHRFYFACLKGLCRKSEIPEGCGLALYNENGWYNVMASDFREVEIPMETMKSIMFHRVKFETHKRQRESMLRHYRINGELKSAGQEVSKALRFYRNWHWQISNLKKEGIL